MKNSKLNLEDFEKLVFSEVSSKKDMSSMLGKLRGGDDGSTTVSSSYTSGTRDCDGTSICQICPKGGNS